MLPTDSRPAISVVMPVRNGLPFVVEAAKSVLDQSLTDFEFLAIDDGSDDGTVASLEAIASTDSRMRLVCLPRTGMRVALNHGLSLARGALVARMDADDVCLPTRFQLQKEFLDNHPDVVAVGGWAWAIDQQGQRMFSIKLPTMAPEIERYLLTGRNSFIHPTMMYRTAKVLEVGGYQDEYPTDDLGLWLRLSERWPLANLPEYLICYRMTASLGSIEKHQRQRLATEKILQAAYDRRGLGEAPKLSADFSPTTVAGINHHWAMSAAAEGNWKAGRKHALIAVRSRPTNLHAWWTLLKSAFHIRTS